MSVQIIIGDRVIKERKFEEAIAPKEPYIYFKEQTEFQCGLCVLNNIYGHHAFTVEMLNAVASALMEAQGRITEAAPVEEMSTAAGMFVIDILIMAVNHVQSKTLGWIEL